MSSYDVFDHSYVMYRTLSVSYILIKYYRLARAINHQHRLNQARLQAKPSYTKYVMIFLCLIKKLAGSEVNISFLVSQFSGFLVSLFPCTLFLSCIRIITLIFSAQAITDINNHMRASLIEGIIWVDVLSRNRKTCCMKVCSVLVCVLPGCQCVCIHCASLFDTRLLITVKYHEIASFITCIAHNIMLNNPGSR